MKKGLSVILSTLLLLACFSTTSFQAASSKTEKLGIPHYSVAIMGATYGPSVDGSEYIFAVANGEPAVLNVIDPASGDRVDSVALEGASFAWGVDTDNNGNVYIAASDKFYHYSTETGELRSFGRPVASENYMWRITVDEEGRVFGGTYPNGKVYMYDPSTDSFTDYGKVVEGQQYVRSIDAVNGKVYAGLGSQKAQLVEIDIATGAKQEIPLPAGYEGDKFVYDLDVAGKHLFARVTGSATLLVYDLNQKKWIDQIPDVKGLDVSKLGPDNSVYFIKRNGDLKKYNLNDYTIQDTPVSGLWSARDMRWITLNEPDYPGQSLISIRYDGNYWIYNPQTGNHKMVKAQIKGEPINIQSLAVGLDDHIYTSAYMSGGLTRYDQTTDTFKAFSGNGQTEGMIATDKYLYMGIYPEAKMYRYDPTKPYDINASVVANPELLFSLKSEGQDRPFAWTQGEEAVYVGTVPDYGKLGGSLSVIYEREEDEDESDDEAEESDEEEDKETSKTYETFTNIVHNQSIISLAYDDELVYGGTSVWGGLGTPPTEEDGKIFIWDTEDNVKTFEAVPVPGHRAVSALSFDDDEYLWGITINTIFKFDPETKEVLGSKELFPFDWSKLGHSWRSAHLQFDPNDGQFYGRTEQGIFTFDPETWDYEVLEPNASLFGMDKNGDIYFARGEELYRYNR
ncbi:hypothetical protein [Pseudalkalibacillus sp. SCS-8]|uniref:hypothetical protein n=1 Tax=Pseudalkalibacillus nanhaiensis TaxID=3115291 RepID=UPI0032DAF4D5